jgi:hypothetical protein
LTHHFWDFCFALRSRLDIPKGVKFDWTDAKDILNGYGYEDVHSNDIFVESVESVGDIVILDKSLHHMGWNQACTFDSSIVRQALDLMETKFWMMVWAHGTKENKKDLNQAYKLRRRFYEILDNCNW